MQIKKDVSNLGQVFTPERIVSLMIGLIKNKDGRILEPSCGDGAFANRLPGCTALEIDNRHAPSYAILGDFFDYPSENKFDVIIGNPPYVKYRDIPETTRSKMPHALCDGRSGLHLHFVEKLIDHLKDNGEMILIIPRDFIKSTGAVKLNERLHAIGTITDFIDLGDERIFEGATPNCAIFRWVKGDLSHRMSDGKPVDCHQGQFHFGNEEEFIPLSHFAYVKVGGVSGADSIYSNENGNEDFVCSSTRDNGRTRRYIRTKNAPHPLLVQHKDELSKRKIRKFDDSNWWKWGREPYECNDERIYVNGKTRKTNPFFYHPCKLFDGSVLGIFPKTPCRDLSKFAEIMNKVPWEKTGFVCDGRFLFSQRSLENAPIPKDIAEELMALFDSEDLKQN